MLDVLRAAGVEGIVIQSSPVFHRDIARLTALVADRRLATICEWRSMAADGCMVGYGLDIGELRFRIADFIVRLFAGGNPAEMPFERPTHFEMTINNKVAHSMGITIPPSLYVRADRLNKTSPLSPIGSAPRRRGSCGGGSHPDSCRLIRKLTSGSAG